MPRDYSYKEMLMIWASPMLYPTSGSDKEEFSFSSLTKKFTGGETKEDWKNKHHSVASPNFNFKENLPMCFLPDMSSEEKSRTASLFYANSEVVPTRMFMQFRNAIPIKGVNDKGDGNIKCHNACEQEWTLE